MEEHIKSVGNFVEAWPYCEGNNIAEVWIGRGTIISSQREDFDFKILCVFFIIVECEVEFKFK